MVQTSRSMMFILLLSFLALGSVHADDKPSKDAPPAETKEGTKEKAPEPAVEKGAVKTPKSVETKQRGDDKMDDSELKELFDRFDEDSNGYLNRKELFHYFVVTTPPDSAMGKKYKQKDYFNLVRYREFCRSVKADPLVGLTVENIKNAYSKHYGYAHKDWVITAGMRSLKIPAKEKQHVKDAFSHFDKDDNGFLNWPEIHELAPRLQSARFERIASALDADLSEGIDLHGLLKVYTRRTSEIRKAVKNWEKPKGDTIVIKEGNQIAVWILVAFGFCCLLAPLLAWFCGVHKTVQGRRVIKRAALELQEVAKST